MIVRVAASTAGFENGNIAGVPVRQLSNWSLKYGDFGSPLCPNGMTCLVVSQFPGEAMCRIETLEPTLGV